uniref:Uncharacterized protein n=1 Tax=Glossina austeni TaxID=7395 RepID=A0A1A9US77_GLOAU
MITGRHIVAYVTGQRPLCVLKKKEFYSRGFRNANSKNMWSILPDIGVTANDIDLLCSLDMNEGNDYFKAMISLSFAKISEMDPFLNFFISLTETFRSNSSSPAKSSSFHEWDHSVWKVKREYRQISLKDAYQ